MKRFFFYFNEFDPMNLNVMKLIEYTSQELNIKKSLLVYNNTFNKESIFTRQEKIILINALLQGRENIECIIDGNSFVHKGQNYFDKIVGLRKKYPKSEIYWLITSDQYIAFKDDEFFSMAFALVKLVMYLFPAHREELFERQMTNNKFIYLNLNEKIKNVNDSIFFYEKDSYPEILLKYINTSSECAMKRIKYILSDERFKHSARVAGTIKKICELSNIEDKDLNYRAYVAAIYHDICKELSPKKQIDIAQKELKVKSYPSWKVLHGMVGAWYLKTKYFYDDEEILEAIREHTIPSKNPSSLTKLLYLADHLELDKKSSYPEEEYYEYWNLIQDGNFNKAFELMRSRLKQENETFEYYE